MGLNGAAFFIAPDQILIHVHTDFGAYLRPPQFLKVKDSDAIHPYAKY